MRITNCCVNHIENPLGFGLGDPTFTWAVEDAIGKMAAASRIVVTCSGATVADTGWADLDAKATQAEGLAAALLPRTRYEWAVSVRSDASEEATSDPHEFETGKMGEPWQASWVTCDSTEPRHPVFSKVLELGGKVASARLYACGLGLYDAYINGRKVGAEHLAPGTNAYDKWLQVATYDADDLIADEHDEPGRPTLSLLPTDRLNQVAETLGQTGDACLSIFGIDPTADVALVTEQPDITESIRARGFPDF